MSIFDKRPVLKKIVAGVCLASAFTAVAAAYDSFFVVEPTDMANVRRFGNVLYDQPLTHGLHFKRPFVESVDTVQVSLSTLHIPAFDVITVDSQKVTLEINFNYTVPANQVNHLLYEVGHAGSADIDNNIMNIAMDRVGRVFNQQNTTMISKNRETVQAEVEKQVYSAVQELFGIQPQSLQIAQIKYSDAFVASNENAVRAKNEAIAEQNRQNVATAKAAQQVITAQGEADAAVKGAEGQAKAVVLSAEADKQKQILDGEGQASRLKAEIATFGSPDKYITYLQAKAALNWNGQRPQVEVTGGGAGQTTAVVVPIPALAAPAVAPH